jgi:AcrR family transcriptional regulator
MTRKSHPIRNTFLQLDPAKRQRVLDAAMAEFADNTFERANLDRIADQAGVAKGSLYQYFAGKRGCFDAVVQHGFGVAFAEFGAYLRRSRPIDCFEEFRYALLFPRVLMRRQPLIARLYFRVGFLEPGELQGEIHTRNSLFQEEWFARGIAAGSLDRHIDRAAAGFLLDAVANRVHSFALAGGLTGRALEKLAQQQTRFVRRALSAR